VSAQILSLLQRKSDLRITRLFSGTRGHLTPDSMGLIKSASAPYVIAPVELIVVLYKKPRGKRQAVQKKSDISSKEFMEWDKRIVDI